MTLTWTALIAVIALTILHRILLTLYRLFLHPLASYPGPLLWTTSRLPFQLSWLRGTIHRDLLSLHARHGPVIRVAPNQLAFSTPRAWKDIYGNVGPRAFWRDPLYNHPPVNGVDHLICALDEGTHARHRRLLAKGFTGEALGRQEEIVKGYMNKMVQRVGEEAEKGPVDLGAWLNYATFDITGDLMFGESFGCLEGSTLHPWVALVFGALEAITYITFVKQFPWLNAVLMRMVPKSVLQKGIDHFEMSAEKADKRIEMGAERPDFMSSVLKNGFSEVHGTHAEKEKVMSRAEIHSNSYILIMAGSETTATASSGICYYLCKYPKAMQRVCAEVRAAFSSEVDIRFDNTTNLKYLNAVIEEGLRIYPPVPFAFPRRPPPGGAMADGYFVPEGTTVAIYHYPTSHSPHNFHLPDDFIPERWLGEDPRFANDKLDAVRPFQLGPTGCLGKALAYAEMRYVLCKLLFCFDMSLSPESHEWAEKQAINFVWNRPPLMIELKKRSGA
ncbi:benzoate 4-monooxygenase cytochrome P450 [Polyplosphaeria fusca]|uniref:Benzoate 4-monooxygenase cytochrome P450 n=1 Tax=Polyplosphaeria fusca TaxID=682080 RepID=A0A9P4QQY0_9PLEO|nr:benzoate 4-monooxygenase cytochrome P450 [Polyplosphaeria fusca]